MYTLAGTHCAHELWAIHIMPYGKISFGYVNPRIGQPDFRKFSTLFSKYFLPLAPQPLWAAANETLPTLWSPYWNHRNRLMEDYRPGPSTNIGPNTVVASDSVLFAGFPLLLPATTFFQLLGHLLANRRPNIVDHCLHHTHLSSPLLITMSTNGPIRPVCTCLCLPPAMLFNESKPFSPASFFPVMTVIMSVSTESNPAQPSQQLTQSELTQPNSVQLGRVDSIASLSPFSSIFCNLRLFTLV